MGLPHLWFRHFSLSLLGWVLGLVDFYVSLWKTQTVITYSSRILLGFFFFLNHYWFLKPDTLRACLFHADSMGKVLFWGSLLIVGHWSWNRILCETMSLPLLPFSMYLFYLLSFILKDLYTMGDYNPKIKTHLFHHLNQPGAPFCVLLWSSCSSSY